MQGCNTTFVRSIFISGTYSLSRLYSENGYPSENPESYRKGQYLVANAFWNVSSNLRGVEYLRGWRTDFSSGSRHANRLNMLVQYSFLNKHRTVKTKSRLNIMSETAFHTYKGLEI